MEIEKQSKLLRHSPSKHFLHQHTGQTVEFTQSPGISPFRRSMTSIRELSNGTLDLKFNKKDDKK